MEFLKPLGLGQNRLARYFNTSPQFWLGMQADYDLDVASLSPGDRLKREVVKTYAQARR